MAPHCCGSTHAMLPGASLPQVVCGTMGMPTATVQMKGPDGIARIGVGVGTGAWQGCGARCAGAVG